MIIDTLYLNRQYNSNINEINRINKIDRDKHKNYKLKDLCLHF